MKERLMNIELAVKALKKTLNSELANDKEYINDCVDVIFDDLKNLINRKN